MLLSENSYFVKTGGRFFHILWPSHNVLTSPASSSSTNEVTLKCLLLHCVRGHSGFYNLALTEENMQNKFNLKLSVCSLGVDISLLSFKFNFGLMGWPPQPSRKMMLKINKIGDF